MPEAAEIMQAPCESFGPRRDNALPDMIVLHYTAMETAEAALERLCDPSVEVSAHYLIAEDGRVWQMVAEDMRAWHAGAGAWGDVTDVNSRSVGIELANTGAHPFPEPQMAALERLMRDLMQRWDIPASRVIGHSDMAPGRKSDPGPRFDWLRLEILGLAGQRGLESGPQEAQVEAFRALAQSAGYTAEVDDAALLAAVRLRYRPWAKGPLESDDFSPLGHSPLRT